MNTLQVGADRSWLLHVGAGIILWLHIAGGTLGILSGTAALIFRKGSRLHRLAGHVFFASMLVMASIGAAVAPFLQTAQGEPKMFDSLAGAFTCYLVATSWMTVRRKAGTTGRFEIVACIAVVMLAVGAVLFGLEARGSSNGLFGGYPAQSYFTFASMFALAAAFDIKVVLQRGISGTPRISRHVWRMGLALFVAVGSFFLGQQRVMPESIQGSSLLTIPPLAVLLVIAFWLVKLRLAKFLGERRRRRGRSIPQTAVAVEGI